MRDKERPELLSNEQAAGYLGLQPRSLTVMRNRGDLDIAYYKVGRRILYDRRDLDRWLAQHRIEPATSVAQDPIN